MPADDTMTMLGTSSRPEGAELTNGANKSKEEGDDDSSSLQAERAMVKRWQQKITKARAKFQDDFDRIRGNMDFVAGLQWKGQKKLDYKKDVINLTLRAVNQGVATLYAKDPKVKATYRKKLDFAMWDGDVQQIAMASQIVQMGMSAGMPIPPDIIATLNDYQQGTVKKKMMQRIGKTLECICQYQIDTQTPNFKTQMKQLVRRVNVCGVGYIKVKFVRDYEEGPTQAVTRSCLLDRAKEVRAILDKMEKGKIEETDAMAERLKELVNSMSLAPLDYDSVQVKERIMFDFPQATSIIPDPCCRSLKGFVGAKWIVEEFYYSLDYVNAFFEVKIEEGGQLKTFQGKKEDLSPASSDEKADGKMVRIWEVTDIETKSTFIICDGHKDYVQKPEVLSPTTKGVWQIFPVTFNDVEVEDGCTATIFPPSMVDLIRSTQCQWNETRYRLARHRRANAPRYMYKDGAVEQEDIDRIGDSEDQEFIKLKTQDPSQKAGDAFDVLKVAPLDPALYNVDPLREDLLLSTGQQEANVGPARPHVTATVGSIAEQSRMSVAASDVDGLDDCLSDTFRCAGELCLREMSLETAKQIAGVGAVWPEQNKDVFINELELDVVAASSGRPNKAIEISNFERVAPLLIQSGANPRAIVKKAIEVLDADIDPTEFYPLPTPPMAPPQQEQKPSAPAKGGSKRTPPKRPQGGPGQPQQTGVPLLGPQQ